MRGIIAIGLILLSVLNLQAQVWTPLNGPNGAYVNSIEVSSTGVIFISTISGNIYRSLDLGVSWSKVYNGNGDFWYDLKIDAAGKVYAIGASLLISSDGVSWTQKSLPSGTYSNWIEKDPVNGYLYFYSYTDKKVYKSIDDGTNWSIVFNSTSSIYSIVCTSSGKVLLSESPTGIWKSTSGDLGTYTQSNSGLLSLDISEMILDGSGNLVAIDNSNFYYSTQASEGGTWF